MGQAWDSEGSGKQAVTRDQKERGAVKGGGRHLHGRVKGKNQKIDMSAGSEIEAVC